MSRMTVLPPLLYGVLTLTACAESIHQVQRDSELLGVPPGLEQEIDTTLTFAELKRAPGEYIGRTVLIGGTVIKAKRTQEGTELEILQRPIEKAGGLTEDRLQSEGRFLAIRETFLDPASLPESTPITVIGRVKGAATRPLDEAEYTYPILEIRHIIDWNSVAAQRPRGRMPYYGAYYPPVGWSGYSAYGGYPYGSYWGGGPGFYRPYPYFAPRGPAYSPPPPPPPPRNFHPRLRGR